METCETSGLRFYPVPGGRIYEVDWQYDVSDTESHYGVNTVFVPDKIVREEETK